MSVGSVAVKGVGVCNLEGNSGWYKGVVRNVAMSWPISYVPQFTTTQALLSQQSPGPECHQISGWG
eukprot:758616-Hanusia_phi.AAC.6